MRKTYLFMMAILIGINGCFFFGTKGVLDGSNYQIVKIEIDNKVLLSPQELASIAKEQISENPSLAKQNINPSNIAKKQSARIDDINMAFEQLRQQNQQFENGQNTATDISELAKLTLKSTFSLDRSQDMLYGSIGCNSYSAKFFWQDSTKIVVSGSATSKKPCSPKEVVELQNTFAANLDGIYTITKLKNRRGYVLNNGKMRIYIK